LATLHNQIKGTSVSATIRRLKARLHDTTGCRTRCQIGLTAGCSTGCMISTCLIRAIQHPTVHVV